MKDLSFLDKLKVLVDVSSSSGICIASIFILVFLGFVMITTNRNNSKHTKILYSVIYILLIVVMIVEYGSSFSTMFDYMMNNLFIAIYFPNLAIYLAAIIATNIILWRTIFNFNEDKLLKVINTIMYCILHYLLVLILNVVNSSGLDVFNNASVYSNDNALALIGLSSLVFMIWIIFIIIYKIIRGRQNQYEINTEINKPKKRLTSNIVEVAVPKVVKDVVKYREEVKQILPPNIIEVAVPKKVKDVVRYKEEVKQVLPSNIVEVAVPKTVKEVVKIKEEIIPKVVEQQTIMDLYSQNSEELKKYENMLTLDDYKIVLDLLKNKSSITTDKAEVNINDSFISTESTNSFVSTNDGLSSNYYESNYDEEIIEQPILDKLLNLRSV